MTEKLKESHLPAFLFKIAHFDCSPTQRKVDWKVVGFSRKYNDYLFRPVIVWQCETHGQQSNRSAGPKVLGDFDG